MSTDNRISAQLTDTLVNEVIADIQAIRNKLAFLVNLSAQDRRELGRMGERSIGFDEKCANYMQAHPEFIPPFIDLSELARDRALRAQLLRIAPHSTRLADAIDDAVLLTNSDIMGADLSYYQSVRAAGKRGIANAQAIYDDLRTRFPGGGRSANESPTPPAAT